jgi:hypothetical protein
MADLQHFLHAGRRLGRTRRQGGSVRPGPPWHFFQTAPSRSTRQEFGLNALFDQLGRVKQNAAILPYASEDNRDLGRVFLSHVLALRCGNYAVAAKRSMASRITSSHPLASSSQDKFRSHKTARLPPANNATMPASVVGAVASSGARVWWVRSWASSRRRSISPPVQRLALVGPILHGGFHCEHGGSMCFDGGGYRVGCGWSVGFERRPVSAVAVAGAIFVAAATADAPSRLRRVNFSFSEVMNSSPKWMC